MDIIIHTCADCLSAVLFVCVPARNKLPLPVNLNLTSVSFIHMLTWEPGPGTPAGVHYNVTVCTETWVSSVSLLPVYHPDLLTVFLCGAPQELHKHFKIETSVSIPRRHIVCSYQNTVDPEQS